MALKDESQPVICVRTGYDLKPIQRGHERYVEKLVEFVPSSTNSSIRMLLEDGNEVNCSIALVADSGITDNIPKTPATANRRLGYHGASNKSEASVLSPYQLQTTCRVPRST